MQSQDNFLDPVLIDGENIDRVSVILRLRDWYAHTQ